MVKYPNLECSGNFWSVALQEGLRIWCQTYGLIAQNAYDDCSNSAQKSTPSDNHRDSIMIVLKISNAGNPHTHTNNVFFFFFF